MDETTTFASPDVDLPAARQSGRARLVRRVALFQVKLFADGLRDVVMSPLSIVAGLIGILFGRSDPEGPLDSLMDFGRRTDRWINLFDAHNDDKPGSATLDGLAEEIEAAIRRDYASGGISARSASTLSALARRLRQQRERTCR